MLYVLDTLVPPLLYLTLDRIASITVLPSLPTTAAAAATGTPSCPTTCPTQRTCIYKGRNRIAY